VPRFLGFGLGRGDGGGLGFRGAKPLERSEPCRSSTLDRSSSFLSSCGFNRSWFVTNSSPINRWSLMQSSFNKRSLHLVGGVTTGSRSAVSESFCLSYLHPTRVGGATGSYSFSASRASAGQRQPSPPRCCRRKDRGHHRPPRQS
jgi:hypothetical protein